jgi:hypothetical protein
VVISIRQQLFITFKIFDVPFHVQGFSRSLCKANKMVSRNYDMGAGESSETATDGGGTDIIEIDRNDAQRSSHRSVSEGSGTVRHGRFQYLGDRPFELTDSLKGYNKVRELTVSSEGLLGV